ncbi:MAG: indole-3-glycerol phosphate synthase TrpC [Elusimicrobiota bacterium]|nr:indole-3-glycerol phosphate synthase TrpC [Endomicrobiia bacterium]MDW8165040.1 indole-3-glycerol phosphate synthase TrpC [Elusimicrobiota bacterium]
MSNVKLNSILEKIIEKKFQKVNLKKQILPLKKILDEIEKNDYKNRNFKEAVKRKPDRLSLIAECKKATPSSGILRENYDIEEIVEEYYSCKYVDAISVLTEENYFLGDISHLKKARIKVSLPILRKDFIIDEYQVYESVYHQADAILLIATILDNAQIRSFYNIAKNFNLEVLIEVHNKEDIDKVLDLGLEIFGINNRNLQTFEVDITTTEKLLKYIPKGSIIISESGISSSKEMKYLYDLGVDGVLIGSYFMKSLNIKEAVLSLIS